MSFLIKKEIRTCENIVGRHLYFVYKIGKRHVNKPNKNQIIINKNKYGIKIATLYLTLMTY